MKNKVEPDELGNMISSLQAKGAGLAAEQRGELDGKFNAIVNPVLAAWREKGEPALQGLLEFQREKSQKLEEISNLPWSAWRLAGIKQAEILQPAQNSLKAITKPLSGAIRQLQAIPGRIDSLVYSKDLPREVWQIMEDMKGVLHAKKDFQETFGRLGQQLEEIQFRVDRLRTAIPIDRPVGDIFGGSHAS